MVNLIIDEQVNNFYYFIEKSNDNKNIIKIKDREKNRTFYIGSKYSVQRDIDNFIKQISEFNIYTIFLVFGVGTGEHILQLLKMIGSQNKILIIEPDKKIAEMFKNTDYYSEIFRDNRVILSELNSNIMDVLGCYIDEININNIKLLVYANYDKLFKNQFTIVCNKLKEFMEATIINMNTNIGYSEQFFKCYIRNLKYIINSTLINAFKDKYENKPAVIVSAGPSLEKNIALLREVQNEFIIVSGIRTVKSLNMEGINPHFVCAIDPTEAMYEVAKPSLVCKAPLIFCECTNYNIVDEYEGEKIFFQEGINLQNITSDLLDVKIDSLWSGGSVAHTCTAFARYMGCNPIIFIGQDFAYTNDKFHADIASIAKNNEIDSEETIIVKDIYGGEIKTSKILDAYRKNMEQFIRIAKDKEFINSTEGGADIKGAKAQSLRTSIDAYSKLDNSNICIENLICKINKIEIEEVSNRINQILTNLKELNEKCISALNYTDEFLENYGLEIEKSFEPLIGKINDINSRIKKIEFVEILLKPTIYRVLMNPEFIEQMNEDKRKKEYRLARQVKKLYEGIITAIEESLPYIKQCVDELN